MLGILFKLMKVKRSRFCLSLQNDGTITDLNLGSPTKVWMKKVDPYTGRFITTNSEYPRKDDIPFITRFGKSRGVSQEC